MSDDAEEAVENAPAVATTDPPTTPVARTPSQTDAVVIGGTSPRDDDRPPPAFTAEDLRRMEEERVRVQELYLREVLRTERGGSRIVVTSAGGSPDNNGVSRCDARDRRRRWIGHRHRGGVLDGLPRAVAHVDIRASADALPQ